MSWNQSFPLKSNFNKFEEKSAKSGNQHTENLSKSPSLEEGQIHSIEQTAEKQTNETVCAEIKSPAASQEKKRKSSTESGECNKKS